MVLRDGAALDGRIYLTEGQTLALYLGSRKGGWVNIVDVVWAADGEAAPHLVLQVDHLALAASMDHDIPAVVGSAVAAQRWVQLGLENGDRLQGCLFLAERQRLSDYLHAIGKFLPIVKTVRLGDGAELGDVALNCAAIKLVRDIAVPAVSEVQSAESGDTPYSMFMIDDTPVTRESVRTDAATLTLLTPGRLPDRRASEARPRVSTATPAALEAELVPLTPQQELGVQRAARHWMGQLAERRGMAPPVGRLLSASPTIGEMWRAVCAANDMAEEELAALVAADFKLRVAPFESIDAKAVAQIPGKIARRLSALPVSVEGNALHVATADPLDPSLEQQLRFVTKMRVEVEVAPPTVIEHALDWWYPDGGAGAAAG
ncbi:MAG: hypothetical protein P3B98_08675 [Gemmatimonadota bacterium]|nr:hypothetical protein [Gemmatimonadota bacterium]